MNRQISESLDVRLDAQSPIRVLQKRLFLCMTVASIGGVLPAALAIAQPATDQKTMPKVVVVGTQDGDAERQPGAGHRRLLLVQVRDRALPLRAPEHAAEPARVFTLLQGVLLEQRLN